MFFYRVVIQGKNFLIKGDDGTRKHGFYTTRYVQAVDSEAAGVAAIQMLRNRKSLQDVILNLPDDSPRMLIDEITQMSSFEDVEVMEPGLTWYDDPTVDHES